MPANDSARAWPRVAAIAVAAVAGIAAVVLTQAPAELFAPAVASRTQGHVQLADVSGTIWRGQAAIVLTPGDPEATTRTRLPGQISWRIDPRQLFLGMLDVTVRNEALLDAPLALRLDAAGNGTIDADRLRLPASTLVGLGAPWTTIQPGGELELQWDTLHIAGDTLHGGLRAEWTGASSRLSPVVPFGHYRVVTDGIYPGATLRLETLSGPMELTGSGTIAGGNRLQFHGSAQVRPGTDTQVAAQLSGLISLLGVRNANGATLTFGM
jgi:general secretion pathway protein N